MPTNQHHQPIGDALPGYTPGARPAITSLHGRYCRLEKLDADLSTPVSGCFWWCVDRFFWVQDTP